MNPARLHHLALALAVATTSACSAKGPLMLEGRAPTVGLADFDAYFRSTLAFGEELASLQEDAQTGCAELLEELKAAPKTEIRDAGKALQERFSSIQKETGKVRIELGHEVRLVPSQKPKSAAAILLLNLTERCARALRGAEKKSATLQKKLEPFDARSEELRRALEDSGRVDEGKKATLRKELVAAGELLDRTSGRAQRYVRACERDLSAMNVAITGSKLVREPGPPSPQPKGPDAPKPPADPFKL
jgi:hypothetical protein